MNQSKPFQTIESKKSMKISYLLRFHPANFLDDALFGNLTDHQELTYFAALLRNVSGNQNKTVLTEDPLFQFPVFFVDTDLSNIALSFSSAMLRN